MMEITQQMSTPASRMDNCPPDYPNAREEAAWPWVAHGLCHYTEQLPNEDGANKKVFRDKNELHLWLPSKKVSHHIKQGIEEGTIKFKFHAKYSHHERVMTSATGVEKAEFKKEQHAEKKREEERAEKQANNKKKRSKPGIGKRASAKTSRKK